MRIASRLGKLQYYFTHSLFCPCHSNRSISATCFTMIIRSPLCNDVQCIPLSRCQFCSKQISIKALGPATDPMYCFSYIDQKRYAGYRFEQNFQAHFLQSSHLMLQNQNISSHQQLISSQQYMYWPTKLLCRAWQRLSLILNLSEHSIYHWYLAASRTSSYWWAALSQDKSWLMPRLATSMKDFLWSRKV